MDSTRRTLRRTGFIALFACFLAVLGIANLVSGFIGGPIWTVIALAGATAGLFAARSLRNLVKPS